MRAELLASQGGIIRACVLIAASVPDLVPGPADQEGRSVLLPAASSGRGSEDHGDGTPCLGGGLE